MCHYGTVRKADWAQGFAARFCSAMDDRCNAGYEASSDQVCQKSSPMIGKPILAGVRDWMIKVLAVFAGPQQRSGQAGRPE
ncbi:hypothetical protein BJF91_10155 [Allorhizobium taibaishanense]|uniref:Uncharacterized protein n=1 Tax=Allorhizobium taibaishanense TaxID=887144 RepID=A0A1Q9AB43_9HYPH|nr:hypothetical protein BJF91_10155 [Allorhizobium taibaishanense]